MSFTNLMVRVSGVALAASLLAGPAFAATTVHQHNSNTGPGSNNQNSATLNNNHPTTTTNTAVVTNVVTVVGNTGGNVQSNNTHAGSIQTGDVSANTHIHNHLN